MKNDPKKGEEVITSQSETQEELVEGLKEQVEEIELEAEDDNNDTGTED